MGKNFRETLNELLNDPQFRAEWDAMEPERQIMRAMLDGREAKAMTQKDLAEATGKRDCKSFFADTETVG